MITVQTGARLQAADHQRRLAGGSKWALAAGGWDNVDSVMTPARRFVLTG